VSLLRTRFFHLKARSLVRANALVAASLVGALKLSGFPDIRSTPWLVLPALVCLAGTIDTARCMQKTWNFYHGGVVLCVYMDLMVLVAILFFLFYPSLTG
jgi:hypothetical protein